MKKIEPRTRYREERGYPSVVDVEVGVSRRGVLGVALAGAAGLGAALVLPSVTEAGGRRGRAKLTLSYRFRPGGCKHQVEKLVVQSFDRRLMEFLAKASERAGIWAALGVVLKRSKCQDITDARRRSALAKGLGKALAARYHKRTGRRSGSPLVTVIVGRYKQRPEMLGDVAMPSVPLPPLA